MTAFGLDSGPFRGDSCRREADLIDPRSDDCEVEALLATDVAVMAARLRRERREERAVHALRTVALRRSGSGRGDADIGAAPVSPRLSASGPQRIGIRLSGFSRNCFRKVEAPAKVHPVMITAIETARATRPPAPRGSRAI